MPTTEDAEVCAAPAAPSTIEITVKNTITPITSSIAAKGISVSVTGPRVWYSFTIDNAGAGAVARAMPPKTELGYRAIPLLPQFEKKIKPGTGLVFPDPMSGKHMTNGHICQLWKKYKAKSDVECSPHQLRHAYATLLYDNKIQPKDAQMLLGHAQLSTAMDIYTDISNRHAKEVLNQVRKITI